MGDRDVDVGVELGSAGDDSRGLLGMTGGGLMGANHWGGRCYGAEVYALLSAQPRSVRSHFRACRGCWIVGLGCSSLGSGASEAITTNPNPEFSRIDMTSGPISAIEEPQEEPQLGSTRQKTTGRGDGVALESSH